MSLKGHYFIYLIGLIAVLISCEGVDLTGEEEGVDGLWELNVSGGTNYLEISPDSVVYYFYNRSEGCINTKAYELLQVESGGFYTLSNGSDTTIVAINRSGDRIHVRDLHETQSELDKYWPSTVDIESLGFECGTADAVLGKWERDEGNGNKVYLEISSDSVTVITYNSFLGCYNTDVIQVLSIDGNVFTVENNDPNATGPQEVAISRMGDTIEIIREEDGEIIQETYTESDFDASLFEPLCGTDFEGMWQLDSTDGTLAYLVIEESVFSFFYYQGDITNPQDSDCFEINVLVSISASGDEVTFIDPTQQFPEPITAFIRIEEGFLHITIDGEEEIFFPNTIDQGFLTDVCQ